MVKLQQLKNTQYIITVDKRLVQAKGWHKGQALKWIINKKGDLELISS